MTTLVKLDKIHQALMTAATVDEVKTIRDKAESLRTYIKQQGQTLEMQNACAEIKIRAERRAGELLAEMERQQKPNPTGRNQYEVVYQDDTQPPSEYATALDQNNISRMTAHRWQTIAKLPDNVFEEEIAITRNNSSELTSSRILQKARRYAARDRPSPPPLKGKYRVIYADPPWKYNDSGLDDYGHVERHYPPLTISELCEMGNKIKDICEDNAVLFLWVTSPLLEECFDVIRAWGFKYKTSFIWDKVKHNHGHYNSVRHEYLLVCVRGSCTPDVYKLFDSVQSIERSSKSSEKPQRFRDIIDTIYTQGNRIELFSRAKVDGWESWGNETE